MSRWVWTVALISLLQLPAVRAEDTVQTLDQLYQQAQRALQNTRDIDKAREARFLADKDKQQALLQKAQQSLAREKQRSEQLKNTFESNKTRLDQLQAKLDERSASLGELFGVVRQVSSDATGILHESLISAQYPGRDAFTGKLADSKALPSIDELEKLWLTLLQEMTESGKVAKFSASVVQPGGEEVTQTVIRVGPFDAIAGGRYLKYLEDSHKLAEFGRQPGRGYEHMAATLEQAAGGYHQVGIDPSRGAILTALVQSPSLWERIGQGKAIGYATLALGLIGLLLALERIGYLTRVGRSVQRQLADKTPDTTNPLGRVLRVHEDNRGQDVETLQHKLDEAILKELPRIERGINALAVIAAIAPMLGLLGTVTGMIQTFESITLFGSGDPRYLSGGISQALVTTEIGLVVAVPIILLHSVVSARGNRIVQVLDEQSAGLIAQRAEEREDERVRMVG
jgi:biopolymer transport protein ExbB